MTTLAGKRFESPDEVREFTDGKGRVELVDLNGHAIGRGTFELGWRWSATRARRRSEGRAKQRASSGNQEMPLHSTDLQDNAKLLLELAQELLDANCDTICLVDVPAASTEWIAHLEYLKGLQRVAQRALAEFEPLSA